MHEIAKSPPAARILVEIPTPRLPEIGDGRKFHLHPPSVVVPAVENVERVGGFFFVGEFGVDVAYHVIAEVVADVEGFESAEFGEFFEEVSVIKYYFRWVGC